jgi:hypothetical protein
MLMARGCAVRKGDGQLPGEVSRGDLDAARRAYSCRRAMGKAGAARSAA